MSSLSASRYSLFLIALATLAAAQDPAFQWSFVDIDASTTLTPCQNVPLSVTNASSVQPPFYMVAYEVGGTTTVSPVGSNPSQLTWQVDHRSGSTLALSLVDSVGNSGGVSSSTWSVKDDGSSSSSSCVPSLPSTSAPTLSSNLTGRLSTCQPLDLLIQGGAPPYTVTIAQLGAGVINATLRPEEDMYTYINRAAPGSTLLVSATDSAGHWASRTLSMTTVGSTDTSCAGLVSSGTSIAALANASTGSSKPNIPLIIGVCLAVAIAILVFCLSLFWLVLRQRRRNLHHPRGPDDEATLVASFPPVKLHAVQNVPKLSIDLAEADADVYRSNSKNPKPSPSDTASSSNSVLDISPQNRPRPASLDLASPPAAANRQTSRQGRDYTVPAPLEPYVPSPSRPRHNPAPMSSPTSAAGPSNTVSPTTSPAYSLRPLPTPPSSLHAHFSSSSPKSQLAALPSTSTSLRNVRSNDDFRSARRSRPTPRARSLMFLRSAVFQHHDSELAGASPSMSGAAHELPPSYDEVLRCSTPPVSASSTSQNPHSHSHPYSHSHCHSR